MKTTDNTALREYLEKEACAPFTGWDFSYVRDRMQEDVLPWSYKDLVARHLSEANSLLDLDTGGGEFLDSFVSLPPKTCATEGYGPNVPVAKRRLASRGVPVFEVDKSKDLPFGDEEFERIICRHGSFRAQDVWRVLCRGGTFITQQVGSMNAIDLNAALGDTNKPVHDWCLARALGVFSQQGFEISFCRERIGKYRFFDVGAVVYYLKCIPWQVPDFSVEKYFQRLEIIDQIIRKDGYMDFLAHRFVLVLRK